MTTFDIVMPLYNKQAFVEATIESVLSQSLREWRLFVVDDGSTDRSSELVANYRDPRVRLMRQANAGVGPARNAGIAAGAAEWIAFLDSDDVWNADHLQELQALARDFPEAVLIGCAFERFSGGVKARPSSPRPSERRLARYFAECARGGELLVTSSAAVRRSALDQVGLFEDLPGNEDVELWARFALHGPVAVSSASTVNYRVDTGGITERGMRGSKAAAKPTKREDFSSTIPTLDRALPRIDDPDLRADIMAYTDSRIGLRLVAAVAEGDIPHAREVLALYRGKASGQARIAAAIVRMPAPLARLIVRAGLATKRWLRRPRPARSA